MLEKWKKAVDDKEAIGASLTDLSKPQSWTVDCKAACIRPISFISEIGSWLFTIPQTDLKLI